MIKKTFLAQSMQIWIFKMSICGVYCPQYVFQLKNVWIWFWVFSVFQNITLANWYLKVPWNQNWTVAKQGQVGQTGPSRTELCQIVPNRDTRGQMGPYQAKRGLTGQTRPNRAKWGWFFAYRKIFMRGKITRRTTTNERHKLLQVIASLEYIRKQVTYSK